MLLGCFHSFARFNHISFIKISWKLRRKQIVPKWTGKNTPVASDLAEAWWGREDNVFSRNQSNQNSPKVKKEALSCGRHTSSPHCRYELYLSFLLFIIIVLVLYFCWMATFESYLDYPIPGAIKFWWLSFRKLCYETFFFCKMKVNGSFPSSGISILGRKWAHGNIPHTGETAEVVVNALLSRGGWWAHHHHFSKARLSCHGN